MRATLVVIIATVCFVISEVTCVSQRKVYTVFTTPKTWNEAHDICNSQFGQLVKIRGDKEIEEIKFLDENDWNYRINASLHGNGFWSGLHRPFNNETWEYQDCEPISSSLTFVTSTLLSANQHCGVFKGSNFDIYQVPCNEEKMFICLRYIGDCWYEPHPETFTTSVEVSSTQSVTEASDCAMQCRHESSPECWAFTWDETVGTCTLFMRSENTASSFYVKEANRSPGGGPDSVFYVRRCFEGVTDTKAYDGYNDASLDPDSYCSTHYYTGEPTAEEVCYCSTQDHPPIPPALSSEAMAEKYAKELTLDTSNTSSAQRKLISAEDNRPSAVGVGFLGVGLLTAIFGGLLLLDIPVFYSSLKDLLCSKSDTVPVETIESEC